MLLTPLDKDDIFPLFPDHIIDRISLIALMFNNHLITRHLRTINPDVQNVISSPGAVDQEAVVSVENSSSESRSRTLDLRCVRAGAHCQWQCGRSGRRSSLLCVLVSDVRRSLECLHCHGGSGGFSLSSSRFCAQILASNGHRVRRSGDVSAVVFDSHVVLSWHHWSVRNFVSGFHFIT